MYYRKDAERAKEAMENGQGFEPQLRVRFRYWASISQQPPTGSLTASQTRWGVGYGPRDCSDYQTGISIIPIHKLTEADRKWMLTAPFGGSGGRPIATGLCVEEPDIEIGAGVSSKAISRRMQTDKGGNHGPKSSRQGDEVGAGDGGSGNGGGGNGGGGGRFRRNRDNHRNGGDNRRDGRMDKGSNEEPVVVGFPPGITMGPNGINFAPGFPFEQ
jgi:protein NRD1